MKILSLTFSEKDSLPAEVTVTMSTDEAAYLTTVLGGMSGTQANAVMPSGIYLQNQIFTELTAMVFNAYWDNGVDDYLRGDRR